MYLLRYLKKFYEEENMSQVRIIIIFEGTINTIIIGCAQEGAKHLWLLNRDSEEENAYLFQHQQNGFRVRKCAHANDLPRRDIVTNFVPLNSDCL